MAAEAAHQPLPFAAVPDAWTAEQIAEFRKAWDEAAASGLLARHQVRWLPPAQPSLDAKAHGSFILHFDAAENSASPDYRPWTVTLDSDQRRNWGGLTAEEVIDFAAVELIDQEQPHG